MTFPPYLTSKSPLPGAEGNGGLWFTKHGGQWTETDKLEPDKASWFDPFAPGWNGAKKDPRGKAREVGVKNEAESRNKRFVSLLRACGCGKILALKTVEPFVTGLGLPSPTETGFAWHWTLGTPYLPGAAVKGVTRAWASLWADYDPVQEREPLTTKLARVFGPDAKAVRAATPAARAGSVRFFDVLPVRPVKLERDVMTPHLGGYYQPDPKEPLAFRWPADWHKPTPIFFLVVAPEMEFITGVAPRRRGHPQDEADAQQAKNWLKDAFALLGAGAKSAKGYGRFSVTER